MPIESPLSADLGAALAARVLHDTAGQASGLLAAFDLLADPGAVAMRDEALALAERSARSLARGIALQRTMLTAGEPLTGQALRSWGSEIFDGARGSLDVRVAEGACDSLAGRVLLGLVQMAKDGAAGGDVDASLETRPGESRIVVEVRGARARLRDEERRGFSGQDSGGGQPHRWALAYWLWTLVNRAGGEIAVYAEEGFFAIEARIARAMD